MPLYEYLCHQCTQSFMLLQNVRVKEGETVCPHCGTNKTVRMFSTFSSTKAEGASDPGPSAAGGHGCGSGGCGCA